MSWVLFLLHGRVTIHTCNMLHVVWQLEPRCKLDAAHSKQQAATSPHRLSSWPCRHLNGLWFVCNLCRCCCSCICLPAPPPRLSNPAETREFLISSRQWEGQCKCQQGLGRGVSSAWPAKRGRRRGKESNMQSSLSAGLIFTFWQRKWSNLPIFPQLLPQVYLSIRDFVCCATQCPTMIDVLVLGPLGHF